MITHFRSAMYRTQRTCLPITHLDFILGLGLNEPTLVIQLGKRSLRTRGITSDRMYIYIYIDLIYIYIYIYTCMYVYIQLLYIPLILWFKSRDIYIYV